MDEVLLPVAKLYSAGDKPNLLSASVPGILANGTITEGDLFGYLHDHALIDLMEGMNSGATHVVVHTSRYPELPGEIGGKITFY